MKNTLFIISAIFVPLLLISMNYSAIQDFYAYSVPLNNLVIERGIFSDDVDIFQKTVQKDDATCFTTPNGNFFCYEKPRMDEISGVSYVRGENGVQGEIHFDPVDKGVSYFTMKNMTRIHDDTSIITLADMDYSSPNKDGTVYFIEEFEYSMTIEKFDVFISHCRNNEGTVVNLVQYIGITTMDGIDYFMTWHTPAHLEKGIKCSYPEIMQYSLEHNFGDL